MALIPSCPVLRPTLKQFSDFQGYVQEAERLYGHTHGMVKVVPPPGYVGTRKLTLKELDNVVLNSPIEQNAYGRGGLYEMLLIQKKSLRVKQYRRKVEQFDSLTLGKTAEQVEELFWKNISYSPPLYGADMMGSIMQPGCLWNLGSLGSLLDSCLTKSIQGVNQPYLYVGSWKTLFAWHKEDLDLYSINYLHMGKPKFWYCIPRGDQHKLEAIAQEHFRESYAKCPEFMRHKVIAMNPYTLLKIDPSIRISKVVHHPNEFVVTFGGTYHQGFNWGFNFAEAVNFATDPWLGLSLKATNCQCHPHTVKIDPQEIYANLSCSTYSSVCQAPFSRTEKFKVFSKARETNNPRLIQQLIDNKVQET